MHRTLRALAALAIAALTTSPTRAEPFVLVSDNNAIHRFSLSGERLSTFATYTGPNRNPQHMAVGPDNHIYVADFFGSIDVYTMEGALVRTMNTGPELDQPAFLTFLDDALVVSSLNTNRVLRYDVSNNDTRLEDLVTPTPELTRPHSIHVTAAGDYLIASSTNTIERFSSAGEHLGTFADQNLARPLTILSADNGNTILVTNFQGPVSEFDAHTGEYLGRFTSDSPAPNPATDGAATLPDGSILIASHYQRTIRRYTQEGTLIDTFADPSEIFRPNGILVVVPTPATITFLAPLTLFAAHRRR
jgi:outer membrane protein assembly factor BamB